jgi:carboxyl-terminal processing protease
MLRIHRPLRLVAVTFVFAGSFAASMLIPHGTHNALLASGLSIGKEPYALSKAIATQRTLELISNEYVDPTRVVPRELFLSALNAIQLDVAQVLVSIEADNQVRVRVEDKSITLKIDDIKGPWDVLAKMVTVYRFLESSLGTASDVNLRDLEFAACNGMLRTLDPHSILFTPEGFKDFNVGTTGKFGGLGIVISIRDKKLTVMKVLPNTPAGASPIKKGDNILQINGESTQTMGINEALGRLRGDVNTKVDLHIQSAQTKAASVVSLIRKEIKIAAVESKALANNIGYVRLSKFSEDTASELDSALRDLQKQGATRGLVLDLRGNPGGLLDQASKVVDMFVKKGTIVVSDGRREGRKEYPANDDGNEPTYPIVCLVNSGSASASEIVAGALKNLDRAVLVGETTFGKGSVQKVERDVTPDHAALKLTIAQYLTPGDISIQSVGITPDIALNPMTVDPLELDLISGKGAYRERDLSAHLSNAKAREGQKPSEIVNYVLSKKERAEMRDRNGDPDDQIDNDYQIGFARRLLTAVDAPDGSRPEWLKKAKDFIDSARTEERQKLADDLKKIGVDWQAASQKPAGEDPKLDVKVEPSSTGEIVAGDPFAVKVTVTNNGAIPLYQLRAETSSEAGIFDEREFVFGYVEPGKSVSWTTSMGVCDPESTTGAAQKPRTCRIPRDTLTRADGITIKFNEQFGHAPSDALLRTMIRSLPRPTFAYGFQVIDDRQGNRDGVLAPGEKGSLYLTVKNVGAGKSYETEATLKNLAGENLLLRDARFDLSNMAPGEERTVHFTYDVSPKIEGPMNVQVLIRDSDLIEVATEHVAIPVASPIKIEDATGTFFADARDAEIFESPDDSRRPFACLQKGSSLPTDGKSGSKWLRVKLDKERFGFVKTGNSSSAASSAHKWTELLWHSPPAINVDPFDLTTSSDKVHLRGLANDGDRVSDLYVFVGSKKIFYASNKSSATPTQLPFDLDVTLRPGINYVSVWARENPDVVQRRVFAIRRDGPNGALLESPKSDDDVLELLGGEGRE